MKRKIVAVAAAAAASLGLAFAPAVAANALTFNPNPAKHDTSVTVVSSNTYGPGKYRVGICSKQKFGTFSVPACGAFSEDVVLTKSGKITAKTGEIKRSNNFNVHAGRFLLNDQPDVFTCSENACEVVITKHNAFRTQILERADLVVY